MKYILLLLSMTQLSCTEPELSTEVVQKITSGKKVYLTRCASCHGNNPSIAGSIGPETFGSSIELLQLKLLKGEYPKDYQKKRNSKKMGLFPDLEDKIPNIHAYLNSDEAL